ncbi:MAG: hydrogenase iron-sulfur subunit [Desulfobaccales bacterium]
MAQNPTVVVLACRRAVPDPALLATPLQEGGLNPRIVPEPCSSKVEVFQMLRILADEADLLWVVGCPEEACQMVEGSARMAKRVAHAREYLQEIGLEPERLRMVQLSVNHREAVSAALQEIIAGALTLGLNPARAGGPLAKEQS